MGDVRKVQIVDFTDGDFSHKPNDSAWKPVTPTIYLRKLANLWLQDQGKDIIPTEDVTYELDRLPKGYVLFERNRPGNPKLIDRHLYGSPRRKFYDSPNRFWPHFKYLMDGGQNSDCRCSICAGTGLRRVASRSKVRDGAQQSRTPVASKYTSSSAFDTERVPDTLRSLLSKLRQSSSLDVAYEEPMSMDWQSERRSLNEAIQKFSSSPAFMPRCGEIVLYFKAMDSNIEICKDEKSSEFKLYDTITRAFVGHPRWEAGVITQGSTGKVRSFDVLAETQKETSVTYSGFRIEPLRKAQAASQYCYVPLHFIRPFVFWEQILNGIPQARRHESIDRAMTLMASFSLVGKFRFAGKWPKAAVAAKGIYLGSELFTVGDAVRLKDVNKGEGHNVSEALTISHITLEFQFDGPNPDLPRCNSSISIYGKVLTTLQSHSAPGFPHPLSKTEVSGLSKGLQGYRWFHRYSPTQTCRVDLHRVLGRCYDAETMLMWFPVLGSEPLPSFDQGLQGIRKARKHAREQDERIKPNRKFFWANSSGEALGIQSVNGIPLADFDLDRDEDKIEEWTEALRFLSRLNKPFVSPSPTVPPGAPHSRMIIRSERSPAQAHWPELNTPRAPGLSRTMEPIIRDTDNSDESSDDMRTRFGLATTLKRSVSIAEEGNSSHDQMSASDRAKKQRRADGGEPTGESHIS